MKEIKNRELSFFKNVNPIYKRILVEKDSELDTVVFLRNEEIEEFKKEFNVIFEKYGEEKRNTALDAYVLDYYPKIVFDVRKILYDEGIDYETFLKIANIEDTLSFQNLEDELGFEVEVER